MKCTFPISAYRAKNPNENGKYPLVFSQSGAQLDDELQVPCGKCDPCLINRTDDWAIRCAHEMSIYQDNCFITLTFDDDHMPRDKSVDAEMASRYIKTLRKQISRIQPEASSIRYFMCGEYGENRDINTTDTLGRPHYHLLIFGWKPDDLIQETTTEQGHALSSSEFLTSSWGRGFVTIGDATKETAAYTARYILKKVNGEPDEIDSAYCWFDNKTGEVTFRKQEFLRCSNRPGIGKPWLDKYASDCFKGYLTDGQGQIIQIPAYYMKHLELEHLEEFEAIKERARQIFDPDDIEHTYERRMTRDKILKRRIKKLERKL